MASARILTTHVGSLPRPPALFELLVAAEGGSTDPAKLREATAEAIAAAAREQAESGVDVIGDGEMGKVSYTHYVRHRLAGVGSATAEPGRPPLVPADMKEHPDLLAANAQGRGTARNLFAPLACVGPLAYQGKALVAQDIDDLKRAAAKVPHAGLFITAASPGTLAHFIRNRHYATEDAYLADLAEAMQDEYEAIHAAGIVLQVDCPDLAMSRHINLQHLSDEEFLRSASRNVEALNHATRNIPPEAMRMHVCWGNYPGPHTRDLPVAKVFDVLFRARPRAILFEAANARHEHEWEDWREAKIPQDKVLIPGAIDTRTNLVDHPRRVAQILRRYTDIVGIERVMAGTDCGFGTVAGRDVVARSVVWSKLRALAEGAELASAG